MDDSIPLERRMGHLERSLMAHSQALALQAQSLEHLVEKMNDRFDGVEEKLQARSEAIKFATGLALSIVLAFGTSVYYLFLEPMANDVAILQQRIGDIDKEMEKRRAYLEDYDNRFGPRH